MQLMINKCVPYRTSQEKFIIADPTYIGANIGMSIPKYKNSRFEVIF